MRGSEDFGRFGQQARAAMFFLGAGENRPDLHNPDYGTDRRRRQRLHADAAGLLG